MTVATWVPPMGMYQPGDSVVIAVPGIVAVLALRGGDDALVSECWDAVLGVVTLGGSDGVRAAAERLLGILRGEAASSAAAVPFALVAGEAGWSRVVGSGAIPIRAEAARSQPPEYVSCDAGTDVDRVLSAGVTDFALGAVEGPEARSYPLVAGVVRAGGVAAGRYAKPSRDVDRVGSADGVGGELGRTVESPALLESAVQPDAITRQFFQHGAGEVPRGNGSAGFAGRDGSSVSRGQGGGEKDARIVQSVGFASLGSRPSVKEDEIAHQETRLRSEGERKAQTADVAGAEGVVDAAMVAQAPERQQASVPVVSVQQQPRQQPAPPPPPPVSVVAPVPPPPAASVPAPQPVVSAPASERQQAVVKNGDADDDEAITATVHQTSRPDRAVGGPLGRPLVSAVKCPAGHPNPPRAVRCRVCPRHVPPQQETQIERPILGVLRLSNGEDILLDRDVLLGREPRSARDTADKPHELLLHSPGKDISRNHLEVRLLGWRVVAIDLGSTNGTTVCPPDGPAESLPPGGTRVIEPGTEVSLAGVVSFIFEATA